MRDEKKNIYSCNSVRYMIQSGYHKNERIIVMNILTYLTKPLTKRSYYMI